MEAYSFPFCIFVSIMTVNHKTVDHSLTVIRNTLRKGESGQSVERGLLLLRHSWRHIQDGVSLVAKVVDKSNFKALLSQWQGKLDKTAIIFQFLRKSSFNRGKMFPDRTFPLIGMRRKLRCQKTCLISESNLWNEMFLTVRNDHLSELYWAHVSQLCVKKTSLTTQK